MTRLTDLLKIQSIKLPRTAVSKSQNAAPKKNVLSVTEGELFSITRLNANAMGYKTTVENHLEDDGKTVIYARGEENIAIEYDGYNRAIQGAFDPLEPRDEKGRWTSGGSIVIPEGLSADEIRRQPLDPSWDVQHVPWQRRSYGAVVVNKDGKFLLRSPTNYFGGYVWTFAKGGLEAEDEHPVDAATREVLQETGVTGGIIAPIPGTFRGTTSSNNYYLMRAKTWDKSAMDKETWSLKWASYEEAKQLITKTRTPTGRARDLNVLFSAQALIQKLQPRDMHGSSVPFTIREFKTVKKVMHAGGPPAWDPKTGLMGPGSGNWHRNANQLDTATAGKLSVSQVEAHQKATQGGWKFLKYGDSTKLTKYEHVTGGHTMGVDGKGSWTIRDKSTSETVAAGNKLQDFNTAMVGVKKADKYTLEQKTSGKYLATNGFTFSGETETNKGLVTTYTKGPYKISLAPKGEWKKENTETGSKLAGSDFESLVQHYENFHSQSQKESGQLLEAHGYTFEGEHEDEADAPKGVVTTYRKGETKVLLFPDGSWLKAKDPSVGELSNGAKTEQLGTTSDSLATHLSEGHIEEVKETVKSKPLSHASHVLHKSGWVFQSEDENGNTVYEHSKNGTVTVSKNGSWVHKNQDGSTNAESDDVFDLGDHIQTLHLKKIVPPAPIDPAVMQKEIAVDKPKVNVAPTGTTMVSPTEFKHQAQKEIHPVAEKVGYKYIGVSGKGKNQIVNYINPNTNEVLKVQDNGYWSKYNPDGSIGSAGSKQSFLSGKLNVQEKLSYKSGSAIKQMFVKLNTKPEMPVSELFSGIDTKHPVQVLQRLQTHGAIGGWNIQIKGKGIYAVASLTYSASTEETPIEFHTTQQSINDPRLVKLHDMLSKGQDLHNASDPGIKSLASAISSWKGGNPEKWRQEYLKWMASGTASSTMKLMINGIATGPTFEQLRRNIGLHGDDYNKWVAWAGNAYEKKKTWHMAVSGFAIPGKGSYGESLNIHIHAVGGVHALDTHKVAGYGNEAEVMVAGDFEILKVQKDFDGKTVKKNHLYIEVKQTGVHIAV